MMIVHVHHTFYPVLGGLERVVYSISKELAGLGHEVHVVTSTYGASGRPRYEELDNIYIHRVKARTFHFPDLTIPKEVPRELLVRADIVHCHSQNSFFNTKVAEYAKRLNSRVAIHFMAIDALYDHPNILIRTLGIHYARYMLRKAISLADLKMCRSLRDFMLLKTRYSVEDIHLVPDGIDKSFITKEFMGDKFREKYKIYDDVILYIGRMHPLKGLKVLIKAIPYVVKEYRHVRFVFIGPGDAEPYKALAKRLGVENYVIFLGFVDEETKLAALDASTCLVLPSICDYVEVYPMVISEAWARRRAVIASSVGGIPYRVKHMVNGLLVPPKDHRKLAKAILTLLQDKSLAKKLGERGFRKVLTWDLVASILLKLYSKTSTG